MGSRPPDPLPATIDHAATLPPAGDAAQGPGPARDAGSRYRPLRFHARGGLGEVHVALDEELNREVALKTIQPGRAQDPSLRTRFLREAEVTARLEHPGVVPVYGMVKDADGNPAYAMRFITGEPLHDAILAFHAEQARLRAEKGWFFRRAALNRRDAEAYRLGLRPLLGHFVAVCNAVAYAHSRGVVHRDLKPQNVMLGKYGETLVVDWGLARNFERTEAERAGGEESLVPTPGAEGGLTEMGRAIGTPAYMSPEQAAGRWDVVGPASDVYSLGATLYFVLTGQPPFREPSLELLLARVQLGDFPGPRAVNRRTPAALDAVCRKAMALEPKERYATALELAGDVNRWLADERVTAGREPLGDRVERLSRRHGKLLGTAWATAVLVLLLCYLVFAEYHFSQVTAEQMKAHEATRAMNAAKLEAIQAMGRVVDAENKARLERFKGRLLWGKVGLAERWAREGLHAPAMAYADSVAAELDGDDAHLRFALAAAAGHASAAARKDARLPEAERDRLAEQYAVRAVARLREAIQRGFRDAAAVQAEKGFDPLRQRKDFQELVAGLKAKPK